jgi:hypothetical protein
MKAVRNDDEIKCAEENWTGDERCESKDEKMMRLAGEKMRVAFCIPSPIHPCSKDPRKSD